MTETLLSASNVLLFGRKVEDLAIIDPLILPPGVPKQVRAATIDPLDLTQPLDTLDDVILATGNRILVKNQTTATQNGIYRLNDTKVPVAVPKSKPNNNQKFFRVYVKQGTQNRGRYFALAVNGTIESSVADLRHSPFSAERNGLPSQIEQQLASAVDPSFARIYGFSFEGVYYELSRPVIFLVHGDGVPATELRQADLGMARAARAPGDPSVTGVGAADFQLSDDILVWSYDRADYTIRLDIETGMFEDILLDAVLGGGGPGGLDSSGMNARGMNARGMNARGMNARGMNARGMNARGNSD